MTSVVPPPAPGERQVYLVSAQDAALQEMSFVTRTAGYEPKTFTDIASALKEVLQNKPQLLVTDVSNPALDGIELCAEVRKSLGRERPHILCVGDASGDLRAVLRDQFGAGLMSAAHMGKLFLPTLRLLSAWAAAPARPESDKAPQLYKMNLQSVVDWLREYNENIANNGLFVEVAMLPPADSLTEVKLRLPILEFELPVYGKVLRRVRGPGVAIERKGFAVELQNFTQAQREALGEFLHSLRQLEDKLGEVRTRLESQPTDWFMLVDPSKRMLNQEMGFLQRSGLAVATFEGIDAAEDFAMSNTVVWVGINEEVLDGDAAMQLGLPALERLAGHVPEVVILRSTATPRQVVMGAIAGGKVYTTTAQEVSARFSKRYQVQLRRSPRVTCSVPVKVHLKRAVVDAETLDVSATGIQLKTTALLALGATVKVEFSLPNAADLSCQGIVVRSRAVQGMCVVGVAFFEYAGVSRNKLREYVTKNATP